MTKAIYFDMDGTIANLYGVDGWLNMLINEDTTPYAKATPLVRLCTLARMLNRLQRDGWHIGIVSWLSKNGSENYNNAVTETKMEWLKNHMPSVEWNEIKKAPNRELAIKKIGMLVKTNKIAEDFS